MLEAPEARLIARQLAETIEGKKITYVSAGYTPHKFAWYHEGPFYRFVHIQAGIPSVSAYRPLDHRGLRHAYHPARRDQGLHREGHRLVLPS